MLVQVETREALKQIEAIASVDGIDGVFIGPNDLSASFGHIGNWGHAEVQAAIEDAAKQDQEGRQGRRHPDAERGGGEEVHRSGATPSSPSAPTLACWPRTPTRLAKRFKAG